ncbi:hypothetical protein [Dyella japonica]|uniref:PH domain-containing protein n=1 Tax=Dyella japonica TaxID=231455 RepID=A0ABV2JYT8_9GAMM
MIESYRPSSTSRSVMLLVGVPGTAIFWFVGIKAIGQVPLLLSCAFVAAGGAIARQVLFDLTMRVDMDAHSITRSWQFGSVVVPIDKIHRLSWGGARGSLVLSIHYGAKRFIQISSNVLTKDELRKIHKDLLAAAIAAHGLEGTPLRPLFSEQVGYIDIDEMIAMKRR